MIASTLVALSLLMPVQNGCVQRHEALSNLAVQYGEKLSAFGLVNTGEVLSVLESVDGDTWTILLTRPDGCTRIIVSGLSWHQIKNLLGEGV